MPPAGFERTISADQRSQTYALDRAVTGTDMPSYYFEILEDSSLLSFDAVLFVQYFRILGEKIVP